MKKFEVGDEIPCEFLESGEVSFFRVHEDEFGERWASKLSSRESKLIIRNGLKVVDVFKKSNKEHLTYYKLSGWTNLWFKYTYKARRKYLQSLPTLCSQVYKELGLE